MKKPRQSSNQPIRDAVVLLTLILLVLTFRPLGVEAVTDLVPESAASGPAGEAAAAPNDAQAGRQLDLPLDARLIGSGLQPLELPGVRVLSRGDDTELDVAGKLICRITRTDTGVETDCSRVVAPPGTPVVTPASWADSCQKKG